MRPALRPLDRGDALVPLAHTVDTLWSSLAPLGRPASLRRIVFVAPSAGQGTTTLAACAALGLARHLNAKVTVVEIGAPSTALSSLLCARTGAGFSELLEGKAEPEQVLARGPEPGLRCVRGGELENAPGALASERAHAFLRWVGQDQDFLILDAPPVLTVPAARPLLTEAEEAVVVVRAGSTRKDEARLLIGTLRELHLDLLGCVLNGHRPDLPLWLGRTRLV